MLYNDIYGIMSCSMTTVVNEAYGGPPLRSVVVAALFGIIRKV